MSVKLNSEQIIALILSLILMNTLLPSIEKRDIAKLRVHMSGRFLVTEDGEPFFWLGDTAWQLFSKLDSIDVLKYLWDRKNKQFTVIHAHVLDWDIRKPNANGDRAFVDNNIDTPNENYWQHADFIIHTAQELGLYMALLPAWGGSHVENKRNSPGSLELTANQAYRYGLYIGDRYEDAPHIIWILGGDTRPTKHDVYDALARGLTESYGNGNPENILISYHPPGGTYRPPATSTGEFSTKSRGLILDGASKGYKPPGRIENK